MADKYIAIAGSIGVGKTTLVEYLTQRYGFVPLFEPFQNNPYLDDFYADMRSWSFHSQLWFLSNKYRLHCQLQRAPGALLQDRTIYEDAEIFAMNLFRGRKMPKRDFETYWGLYEAMKANLQPPDLLIYLHCSTRAQRKRIRARGRPSEQGIPLRYIKRLDGLYTDWIDRWDASPVLAWDTDSANYLSDLVHRIEFHKAVEAHL